MPRRPRQPVVQPPPPERRQLRTRGAGGLRVAVVHPAPAGEGYASLAVHVLVALAEAGGAEAEPVFQPARPGERPRGELSGLPLGEFDLLAVSAAFEEQWPVLPHLLSQAGLPARAAARDERHPIVLLGGVGARLNPRPVLPFVDLLAPGDAEAVLPPLLARLEAGRGSSRTALLESLRGLDGLGVQPFSAPVPARFSSPARPVVEHLPRGRSLLAGMRLVETGRGCPAGCRFCALGFSRRPPMFFPAQAILEVVREAGPGRVGLVGASLGRHPGLGELLEGLAAVGVDLSPASLDPGVLAGPDGARLSAALARGGQRTLTLAPEAGSERLRRVLHKAYSDQELEAAVRRLGEAGVIHLKLYLMFGLPTETDDDLEAAAAMVIRARGWLDAAHRGRGGTGRVSVSLNPFVPKPHTPFAREPMPTAGELRRRRARLLARVGHAGGVQVGGMSVRRAILQAVLTRADEAVAGLLEACQGRWPPPAGLLAERAAELAARVHAPWPDGLAAPWEVVACGVAPAFLAAERARALEALPGLACPGVGACRACGACGACGAADQGEASAP
jgi:radical SAM superfamily enzyme YgiQ (UPF0313 family)